jgi:hypothetical protein
MMIKYFLILFFFFISISFKGIAQKKFLFDASKAETAGNADWIIDADHWNLDYTPYAHLGGNEANAQRYPSPAQNNIHNNTSETYWKGALSAWGVELVKRGYTVETLPYNGQITYMNSSNVQDLSNYDVFVVCEPNIKFTSSEKSAILQFVKNGGGLFMVADHNNSDRNGDGYDSPFIWNDLMFNNSMENNPFGIKFDYEFFNEFTNNIVNNAGNPITNGEYGKVTKVEFYGGTSMTLYPNANGSVHGVVYKQYASVPGNQNVMCAYASFGEGKVVALGDSSPADDGSGDIHDNLYDGWLEDANGNHRKLIMNGSVWLAEVYTSLGEKKNSAWGVYTVKDEDKIRFRSRLKSPLYDHARLFVYRTDGTLVREKEIDLNSTMNYITLRSPGVYVYKLLFNDGKFTAGKVVF